MFCHEPNTWHQKIGSRFPAETGHRRSRFGVALADLGGVLVGDNTPGDFLAINQSRVPWVRGACSLALCDLRRAGVRCRSPTLRSLSYPGELWIFAERCASSERSGPYTPGLPCDQSVPGACSLALSDLRRVGVRCRSPTLRSLSYPVNCGSSRKGVTHQSVLGHISGCRLQNCCSSHGSRNISGCRFQNSRSSTGSQNIFGCRIQNC